MKLLGICGSPRTGNTEWMMQRIMEDAAGLGVEVDIVLLRKLRIRQCDGCGTCQADGMERQGLCRIRDDMQLIYPKLIQADALVLGTPVYFDMLSGQLKTFMDRTCALWPRLKGKRVCGLAVAEESIGKAVQNLQTYTSVCNMQWVGAVSALASGPRDVSKDQTLARRIRLLSKKLVRSLSC